MRYIPDLQADDRPEAAGGFATSAVAAPDRSVSSVTELGDYVRHLYLPWCRTGGRLLVAHAGVSPAGLAKISRRYGSCYDIQPMSRGLLLNAIEQRFRTRLSHDAVHALADARPDLSADKTFTPMQIVVLAMAGTGFVFAAALWPRALAVTLAALFSVLYLANVVFRGILVWIGAPETRGAPALPGADDDLPVYTVLVPLYREAEIVPALIAALRALDYPPDKLDIKLIVEADDAQTCMAVARHARNGPFEIVAVPPGRPRTKPKACNYALRLARGTFTVIFDAEDRPDHDQLRKAVAAFSTASQKTACLQARLNFYNRDENWLTRLFALDYALWFDFLLPGLDRLGVPMPLGGTSNHFRTDILRAVGGWDAFNVTEDADLGVRLTRLGYRTATLDSSTFEEAPSRLHPWLKQRTRWLKGYMQTWLVHMRDPAALLRQAGLRGFLAFHLFVGGTFAAALANPLLWCVFAVSYFAGVYDPGSAAAAALARTSILSLIAGNAGFVYLAMLGPYRRGWLELTPYGLLAPFYWACISLAGLRALVQLLVDPFRWDKTDHGLSLVKETAS